MPEAPPLLRPVTPRRRWFAAWTLREFIALGVFAAAPFIAFFLQSSWYVVAGLGAAFVIAFAVIVHNHGGLELLGPHFFYDMLRLGRRGRSWNVRVLYAVGLLVGLAIVYWARFSQRGGGSLLFMEGHVSDRNEMALFAETFVFTVTFIQNLAVFLLAPVYLGSAIAEEKERGTLQLLFTTHLRDREIVLGKLMSRLLHLGVILLGGLPVLSLAQLWGGVDMGVLALNFLNTALNLLSVSCLSILVSILCKRVITAIMIVYGALVPFVGCFSIVTLTGNSSIFGIMQSNFAGNPGMIWAWIGVMSIFHSMVIGTCLGVSLWVLRGQRAAELDRPLRRPRRDPPPGNRRPGGDRSRPRTAPLVLQIEPTRSIQLQRYYELPPIHNDPLFWKEFQLGGPSFVYSPTFYVALILPCVSIILAFLAITASWDHHAQWRERLHSLSYVVHFFVVILAGLYCLAAAYRACAAVVRERMQKTLDSLLMVPESRQRILLAKWLGNYLYPVGIGLGLVGTLALGTVTGALHFLGAFLATAAIAIHAAFLVSLGLYLSVISRTILAAHARMAMVLVAMFGGTFLWGILLNLPVGHWAAELVEVGLNPARTWITLGFSYRDFSEIDRILKTRLGASLAGLAFYALLALIFWLLACRAFARERYRHVE